jgi:formylglycine-generating enzyme required for sulfatase activity
MKLRLVLLIVFLTLVAQTASPPAVGAPRRVAPTSAFLAVLAQSAISQGANAPLGKDQVLDLVKYGMDSAELAKRIEQHGIDFEPSDEYLETLRKAGAQEPVIQALREVRPKPLTREQVGKLVAGGVPSERAAMLVKQHGIDFVADERYLQTLRLAGADDTLIAALREASKAVTGELVVVTSPDAEVYLDGELQGRAGAQGELMIKTSPGAHALKVSLKGKKDFQQSVTLTARQATKIGARLEDVGPAPGQVRVNPKDGLKYAWIPPGTFMMGCSPGDNECSGEETPAHQVTITRGFWMGQTPVTVGAYKRFLGPGGKMPDAPADNIGWADENMPMVNVTWLDASVYCQLTGGRLPTEAEWEFAARGGSTEARYGPIDEIAWYAGNSDGHMHDVAQKRPNGFGLYDMLGNAWEWVKDWNDYRYYENSPSQDPQGPKTGSFLVLRGGSWQDSPRFVRVSRREAYGFGGRAYNYGFRCVGGEAVNP